MRHTSNKRARLDREWRPIRLEYWSREFPRCMACRGAASCVHEIACGMSIRSVAKYEPCTWLSACSDCNQNRFTNYELYPLERQLALKFIFDVRRLDLPKFNEIRGRAPGAITLVDVHPWILKELQS